MSLSDIFAIIFAFIFAGVFLQLVVPFIGVVTRYRINYTPKGVGLGDVEEGEAGDQQRLTQDMRVGPVVNSLLAMFVRTKRIEGYVGLYKGLMPLIVTAVVQHILSFIFISGGGRSPKYAISSGGIVRTFFWALVIILWAIPREILVNRAIVTPHKLGWFSPVKSLRILFTPYERSKPWVLYLTPGLALSQILHTCYLLSIVRVMRSLLVPALDAARNSTDKSEWGFWAVMGLSVYVFFLCLSFIVLAPLEVLASRLSVQRTHPRNSEGEVVPGEGDESLEYAGADEDVIGLRDEGRPYLGMWDAVKTIVEEEGWATLYRAFYLTIAGTVVIGFS